MIQLDEDNRMYHWKIGFLYSG